MELRHLRYFAAVVEAGSLVAAARRLHISQPPLSHQIRDLEDELGAALLERKPRGVEVTAAGRTFYEGCRWLLDDVDKLVTRTQRAAAGHSGRLRVAASQVCSELMVEALMRFAKDRPGVVIEPSEMRGREQAQALLRGDVDVTLGYRLPALEHPDLEARVLSTEKLVLAVPASKWPALAASRRRPTALSSLTLLTMPAATAPALRAELLSALARIGVAPADVRGFASLETVLTLVACGAGFGAIPRSLGKRERAGVRFLPLPDAGPTLTICAFVRDATPVSRHFLRLVKQVAAGTRGSARRSRRS